MNARAQPVHNQELIKELWQLIKHMDQQKKIKVLFWKVAREDNADADRLANAALDATGAHLWDSESTYTAGGGHICERTSRALAQSHGAYAFEAIATYFTGVAGY
ncbi:hypothetical protein F4824DRAFT_138887 [Ustulina deusta]|nr:hypothetical protein F4824DRAFT_138887 [Ustulina deusta]